MTVISALAFSQSYRDCIAVIRERHRHDPHPTWIYARASKNIQEWEFCINDCIPGTPEWDDEHDRLIKIGYSAVIGTGEPLTQDGTNDTK